MAGEGANQINVNINTTANMAGIQQAAAGLRALQKIAGQLTGTLGNVSKTGTENAKVLTTVATAGNSATKSATKMAEAAKKTATESRAMGAAINTSGAYMRNFTGYANGVYYSSQKTALSLNTIKENASGAGQTMVMAGGQGYGAMGRLAGGVASGVSKIGGYFGGLIRTSISVGDVFGYYIGTMALQAVGQLVMGVAEARDEMTTTFEFMGYQKKAVKAFADEMIKFGSMMPKLSVAGTMAMSKLMVMGGATMQQVSKWKTVWADMATVAMGLRNIQPDVAGQKTAMAIADAVGGKYRRLQYIMGVTTTQFKAKAKEMGFTTQELVGNFDNTMAVIQEILSDRGLTGIATKLTSLSDVWTYLSQIIMAKGSQMGDMLVSVLIPAIKGFASVVTAMPTPIFAAIVAFVGLLGAFLVFLPLAASVINSFAIMEVAAAPILTPLRNVAAMFRGLGAEIVMTTEKTKAFMAAQILTAKTAKVNAAAMTPIGWQMTGKERMTAGGAMPTMTMTNQSKGFQALSNRINAATTSLGKYNAANGVFSGGLGRSNTGIRALGGSLKSGAAGFGAFATSILGAGRAMLVFMLTTPVGLIITITAAILILITVTGQWGNVMKAIGGAWDKIKAAIKPAVDALRTWAVAVGTAIQAWGGWDVIIGYISLAASYLTQLGGLIASVFGKGAGKEMGFLSDAFQKLYGVVTYVMRAVSTFWSILMTGKGAFEDTNAGIIGTVVGLLALISPLGWIIMLFTQAKGIIAGVKAEWDRWTSSIQGSAAIAELKSSIGELKGAFGLILLSFSDVWKALQPALQELFRAFNQIVPPVQSVSGSFKEAGGAANESTRGFSLVTIIVDALKLAVYLLTIGVQAFTWFIRTIVIPSIHLLIPVISFLIGVITACVNFVGALYRAWLFLVGVFNTVRPVLVMIAMAFSPIVQIVQMLWHWIMGASPGLIPAFKLLVAVARSVFPTMRAIISSAISAALSFIIRFVSNTVSWFKSLPGKIYSALSGIRTEIVKQLQNAYNGAVSWLGNFVKIGTMIKDKVVNGIKSALGIRSPSTVTQSLGTQISQGLFVGMKKWVIANATKFMNPIKDNAKAGLKILADAFNSFKWVNYMGQVQGVSTTISKMSGNCYDAADAFIALARSMGINAQMYRTFVNGIPHRVVNLPGVGAWIDPSGILGRGIQKGNAPGSPAGAPVVVYQSNPTVKDEIDLNKLGVAVGQQVINALRFGI